MKLDPIGIWKGENISELPREKLFEIIKYLGDEQVRAQKQHSEDIEVLSKLYKPKHKSLFETMFRL